MLKAMGCAAAAVMALLCAASAAQASPVDVSYTVSGSAGNWSVDFSVTNNLGNTNVVYFFGFLLPTDNQTASPANWDPDGIPTWNNAAFGGSSITYNDVWIAGDPIQPGQSLSGFKAIDTDLTSPSSISWFAYAEGGHDDGSGCDFNCVPNPTFNPGFEGTASVKVAATPLPGSMPLLVSALGGLGVLARRRKARVAS